jgi:hypothetical protein
MRYAAICPRGLEPLFKEKFEKQISNIFIFESSDKKAEQVKIATQILKVINIDKDLEKVLKFDYKKFYALKIICSEKKAQLNYEATEILNEHMQLHFSNPEIRLFLIKEKDTYILAEDFLNRDVSKREYRIFTTRFSLNGTSAYALSSLAKEKKLAFIATTDGIPAVEFALLNKQSFDVYGVDQIVTEGARKNALVAEVSEQINFNVGINLDKKYDHVLVPLNFRKTKMGSKPINIIKKIYPHTKRISLICLPEHIKEIKDFLKNCDLELNFFQGKLEMCLMSFKI